MSERFRLWSATLGVVTGAVVTLIGKEPQRLEDRITGAVMVAVCAEAMRLGYRTKITVEKESPK